MTLNHARTDIQEVGTGDRPLKRPGLNARRGDYVNDMRGSQGVVI